MAGQASGDRQVDSSTDEATAREQESIGPDAEVLEEAQTLAAREQAASDRDVIRGGDRGVHDIRRDLRDRSAQERHDSAERRLHAAAARDAVAHSRDLRALARDQAAALRDREGSAADRAVEARARAGADREQAARDRKQAARDRSQAEADREALMHQLAIAETDPLTGVRTRAPGLADLGHEIDRARRTAGALAVAYVDIVGLKVENDNHGHAAGDALLQRAVSAIRGHLRSYDMIVRIGGDEFLCVMSGATIEDARRRFASVHPALAAGSDPCEIKVGFAALKPQDSAAELIERADSDLPNRRGR